MSQTIEVRAVTPADYDAWRPLWDGYNRFYGRFDATALPESITATTWTRFFDGYEPMHALIALQGERVVGLVHFIYHRNTTLDGPICYLQDLFTVEDLRGKGVGRALIEAVYAHAKASNSKRVYWHTHETNRTAMRLYDDVADKPGFVMYRKDV
ncbi:GNAT superfamily N-acetyltransferase [Paraburkholderia bannensis]|uniref:GNAT superfamily N-acetyltransferase n=1 Tax=Paraburkholderia bannensis TaxID=765414 RepID=A0A7W9WV27_9BURK|nr:MULTISPECIES: GNAT family N-acetyltransferase [Paraburkholderia]MBB3260200.1 GNAT superfamily N-acetyltransferase [Paraburkholderia sp. WP4_3_2]MBB6105012.1 GNAT superfamily N-acetyltransferase [Paraburkholderia bannensis]